LGNKKKFLQIVSTVEEYGQDFDKKFAFEGVYSKEVD